MLSFARTHAVFGINHIAAVLPLPFCYNCASCFDTSNSASERWFAFFARDRVSSKRWRAFLRNHREATAAMDFFTVPTITFGLLYCLFVMGHDRRRILHFNVTKHPASQWIVQQLRESFPFDSAPRFLI